MGDIPTTGQMHLLFAAACVFIASGIASVLRFRAESNELPQEKIRSLRTTTKASLYSGIILTLAVLLWHCIASKHQPLEDNFGAFLCLGILLASFVAYTQRAHPLRGLDLFVIPVVLLLMVLAAVFGKAMPHQYREGTWSVVHLSSAFVGFVAFAVAGAVGVMYLLASGRLRRKKLQPGHGFGSLERLEHLTRVSVTFGFALLTISLVTGFFLLLSGARLGPRWYSNPIVALTCLAWLLYALVLHSPINPSFRGRKTAILSVVGFLLMVGIVVAIEFRPTH